MKIYRWNTLFVLPAFLAWALYGGQLLASNADRYTSEKDPEALGE